MPASRVSSASAGRSRNGSDGHGRLEPGLIGERIAAELPLRPQHVAGMGRDRPPGHELRRGLAEAEDRQQQDADGEHQGARPRPVERPLGDADRHRRQGEHKRQDDRRARQQQAARHAPSVPLSKWSSEGARSRSSSGLSGRPRLERITSSAPLRPTTIVVAAAAA